MESPLLTNGLAISIQSDRCRSWSSPVTPWAMELRLVKALGAHTLVVRRDRHLATTPAWRCDERAVRAGVRLHRLLEEAVEEHAPSPGTATVEPERELIEVG